jgi:hypothetical protein
MNIDQQYLDRLVDGELQEEDRRRLIESFEQQPGGWRQCACAFLESQELSAAFNGYIGRSELPTPTTPRSLSEHEASLRPHDTAAYPARRLATVRRWAALAACLVIGFGIGQFGGRGDSGHPAPTVASDARGGALPVNQDALLAADGNAGVVAREPRGESILEQQFSAIPSDIEDILDRLGQRVERRQILVPVRKDRVRDGRNETVPVEEIEIVPVRWETY